MEIFQHRFYKSLDDSVPLTDVNDNDTVVCFELPCNARQGRMHKKGPDDPFILPVFLSDAKPPAITRPAYGMTRNQPAYFGYPTIAVIDREQATSVESIYEAVIHRLERWTKNARDLFVWEAPSEEETITEIPASMSTYNTTESVTEITPEGDVREVHEPAPAEEEEEEVDISDDKDDKGMVLDADDAPPADPRSVGPKSDIFELRLQTNYREFAGSYSSYTQSKWEQWDNRKASAEKKGTEVLLQHNDALFCEFDENMKAYFFGETRIYEHSNWEEWSEFIHPEYEEAKKAGAAKHKKGLTLEDCLEEFVKEEQLGEEDLWYCPECKKHQQATKKFDLWKAPDILVVHLKRFSNNRILRDKIDSFVEFPVEGLDLGEKVGERAVAKRLMEKGIEMEELKSVQLDEPLVYDLFAVDEHMGGLGGGHYRAYSSNHLNDKWYHFDDAYVTPAQPHDAVVSPSKIPCSRCILTRF
jgi:ubiquitin carboxyl-terminal hydrolase 4/11/15